MQNSEQHRTIYRFGIFEIDPAEGRLLRNGVRVKIQEQPLRLLTVLLESPDRVVLREEIRTRLWAADTFVEFDASLTTAVAKLRAALGDTADNPRFIQTVPKKGYRFIAPVSTVGSTPSVTSSPQPRRLQNKTILAVGALAVGALVVTSYWRHPPQSDPAERPEIVIGDFLNRTGNPVFDGSLRRATVVQLAQSPYLTVVSDETLGETLQGLGRPPDQELTPALARQVCEHAGASAAVNGTIQGSNGAYVLSVEAARCGDGAVLARERLSFSGRERVLPELGRALQQLRRTLGESAAVLRKFDVPVEQGTTESLEALKAYQLGLQLRAKGDNPRAAAAFQSAISLDPNFAIAYAQLGSSYSNQGEPERGTAYLTKAFELRDRATEPEQLYITGRYFDIVTGELERASATYKLWTHIYPQEWSAYNNLANDANLLGRYDVAVAASRRAISLEPNQSFGYANLIFALVSLNRFDEARSAYRQAIERGCDDASIHLWSYGMAFVQGDESIMNRETGWAKMHPGDPSFLYAQAEVAAFLGQLKKSNQLFDQLAERLRGSQDVEIAAAALATSAQINADLGYPRLAVERASAALQTSRDDFVFGLAALVYAKAGNPERARQVLEEFDRDYPLATFNMGVFAPVVRTVLARAHDIPASEVTTLLQPALPYEYGQEAALLPIYERGEAYRQSRSPQSALQEFQKLIQHRAVDPSSHLYPLALLGAARCYAALGQVENGKRTYAQLLDLWKQADIDLPALTEARREYRALASGTPSTR